MDAAVEREVEERKCQGEVQDCASSECGHFGRVIGLTIANICSLLLFFSLIDGLILVGSLECSPLSLTI